MSQTHHHAQSNGHRNKRTVADVFGVDFRKLDMENTVRKHPLPAIAIASCVGAAIGMTVGSRIMRMIVGTVGMYIVGDVVKRYAREVLDPIVEAKNVKSARG